LRSVAYLSMSKQKLMCQVVAKCAMAVGLNSGLCVHGKCKLVVQAYKQKQNEDEKKKRRNFM